MRKGDGGEKTAYNQGSVAVDIESFDNSARMNELFGRCRHMFVDCNHECGLLCVFALKLQLRFAHQHERYKLIVTHQQRFHQW